MESVITGLEQLASDKSWQKKIKGNVAYLCHSASVDKNYRLGVTILQNIFGKRLTKIFGPQHGFVTDVQDNMIETYDYNHPYFQIPVLSLYGETRVPTDSMLENIDSIVVDLQDVGTRVYTYISTLALLMEVCAKKDIDVFVLDRPNPVGGKIVEGNILEPEYKSFVGIHPIPMRHALTMGEIAQLFNRYYQTECNLTVIPMKSWQRRMFFSDTDLPWVNPSPNLPTIDGAFTFVGTVLFEGTNISEGRGTTRSLEVIGHPEIEPFSFMEELQKDIEQTGFVLRPLMFYPMFQKHKETSCGGFHIHVTDKNSFRPWTVGQQLMQKFYNKLGNKFQWKSPPYEYEYELMPIDLINGSSKIRQWIESNGSESELHKIERNKHDDFLNKRASILIYS